MGPEVEAPADRKYSCWLGGAILSLIDKFDKMWIEKQEFETQGASIVHKKCF
jgi:actin-related protein